MRSGTGAAATSSAVLGDDVAQREGELAQAGVAHGRDLEHAEAASLEVGADQLGEVVRLGDVDLVERDDLRALEERQLALGHGVGGELGEDHVEVGQRVATGLERRAVEHVDERRAALDVAEELEAEPLALARALDETGHVGDGEAHVAGLDHAEVRVERGERVVGDLRPRGGDRRDEAGLARRREADQRDVGDRLELEDDIALPAGRAQQGEAGRLALRVREGRVAESADAAGRGDEAHARLDHVDERLAGLVLDDGADRHRELEVLAGGAGAVVAHPEPAVAGRAVRRVVVRQQRRDLRIGDEHDVAAVAAVAAIRTGERLELLALHGDAAIAALAGAQVQRHAIDERNHALSFREMNCASVRKGDEPKPAPFRQECVCVRLLRERHDVDDLAAALLTELDRACLEGEQRVVAATADVGAGVEVGAALADDDLAGEDLLTAEALHAQSLSVGVTTVAGGACALFVCHLCVSSWTT